LGAQGRRGQEGKGRNGTRRAAVPIFDEEPVRVVKPKALDDMSIQDLKDRIEELKADIIACEAAIAKKEATRKAAEAAFFKS
jgi:uncharacterized small protein (DUF1192 family)